MNYPADSTAKLWQGGKGRYVGREGVPVDNCSREKCEPVIVFSLTSRGSGIHNVITAQLPCTMWLPVTRYMYTDFNGKTHGFNVICQCKL